MAVDGLGQGKSRCLHPEGVLLSFWGCHGEPPFPGSLGLLSENMPLFLPILPFLPPLHGPSS